MQKLLAKQPARADQKSATKRKNAIRPVAELASTRIAARGVGTPFDSSLLNDQLMHYCQLTFHTPEVSDLRSRWSQALDQDLDFIPNPNFSSTSAEANLLLGELFSSGTSDERLTKSARLASLPAHLARLCETRLLTADQEKCLFLRMNFLRYTADQFRRKIRDQEPNERQLLVYRGLVAAADWHRDLIVKSNMRLVISIVKKFVNTNNLFDDLLSDGIMALIRAVEKFDVELGFRFSTYATQVVRRNSYRLVMSKQKERLKMGTSLDEVKLDIDDRDAAKGMSPERWDQLRNRLSGLLNLLDRREKLIVRARFSLGSHRKVQTLQRIADSLGVSKERVRQLESRALVKLRALASAQGLPEFVSE